MLDFTCLLIGSCASRFLLYNLLTLMYFTVGLELCVQAMFPCRSLLTGLA